MKELFACNILLHNQQYISHFLIMNTKVRNILGWVLAGLLGFVFIGSASAKFMASPETLKMLEKLGLNAQSIMLIGLVELASIILFLIPRTGIIGTLLLAAYMGGAIATHLEHQEPFIAQAIIEALVWITAVIRFPELTQRFLGKQ